MTCQSVMLARLACQDAACPNPCRFSLGVYIKAKDCSLLKLTHNNQDESATELTPEEYEDAIARREREAGLVYQKETRVG